MKKCVLENFAKFTRKHFLFCKVFKNTFLQNTSRRLLLLLAFQKQPPEVFYEKRCSWKFRKIHRKTPLVLKLTPFLQNTSEPLLLAFLCNVSKMGYCQHCYHYLETLILEVPFRYITSFFGTINFQHMSSLVYTVYCQKQPSD